MNDNDKKETVCCGRCYKRYERELKSCPFCGSLKRNGETFSEIVEHSASDETLSSEPVRLSSDMIDELSDVEPSRKLPRAVAQQKTPSDLYRCMKCQTSFDTADALVSHLRDDHEISKQVVALPVSERHKRDTQAISDLDELPNLVDNIDNSFRRIMQERDSAEQRLAELQRWVEANRKPAVTFDLFFTLLLSAELDGYTMRFDHDLFAIHDNDGRLVCAADTPREAIQYFCSLEAENNAIDNTAKEVER